MSFRESIINNVVQVDNLCRILPDDEIRRAVDREVSSMVHPVKSMVLTWEKLRTEYVLEIVLSADTAEGQETTGTRRIAVGCVSEREYDALNKLVMAGRRLYFRLRGDYPKLRRRLSTYRYLAGD